MASQLSDDQLRALYARATAARRDPERAACPTPDALLAAVRREGSEHRRLEVIDHAMTCADCRQDFELLRAFEASRRADAGAEVAHIRWRRPLGVALAVALAAAVVVVAVLGPWQNRQPNPGADVLRGDPAGVAVIAPADDVTVGLDTLTFTWRAVAGARRYTLELLTPGGAVAATRQVTDTSGTLDGTGVALGDYRWSVRAHLDGGERVSAARRLRVGR